MLPLAQLPAELPGIYARSLAPVADIAHHQRAPLLEGLRKQPAATFALDNNHLLALHIVQDIKGQQTLRVRPFRDRYIKTGCGHRPGGGVTDRQNGAVHCL